MTFTHEGNKTFIDNMVNFEKMVSLCARFKGQMTYLKGMFYSLVSQVVVISKEPLIPLIFSAYYSKRNSASEAL